MCTLAQLHDSCYDVLMTANKNLNEELVNETFPIYREITEELLKEYLPKERWHVKLSRAKHVWGMCSYSRRTIFLSKYMISHATDEEIIDTVLHEVAHAIAGNDAGHGEEWLKVFLDLGGSGEEHARPLPLIQNVMGICKCRRFGRTRKIGYRSYGCNYCGVTIEWFDQRIPAQINKFDREYGITPEEFFADMESPLHKA